MNATGYVRRSKKSEGTTVSLQEQRRQIEDYCTQKGFALCAVVSHDGVSGAKRERWDEINRVIAETASGALVIYNLDRLSRDAAGLLDNIRRLSKTGIVVHEVGSGAINLSKSTSKLTVSVRGVMDEFYRDVVSEKTADALRFKRENGQQYTRIPPFGFSYLHGRLVQNIEEQRALEIISSCRRHGFGARRTKHALVRAGYSGRMGIATIHRLLKIEEPVSIKEKLPASYFGLIQQD